MKQENIPIFPVAEITVAPISALGLIMIRPDFLSNLSQAPAEATTGRNYALTHAQALFLAQKILSLLDQMKISDLQDAEGQKH